MLSRMCALSLVALTSLSPRMPSGTLSASSACSVTIQAYPASVMFKEAASLKMTLASCLLRNHPIWRHVTRQMGGATHLAYIR